MSETTFDERPAKLIGMANQIAHFFKPYPEDDQVRGIRDHIAKFWDVKMRKTILAYARSSGEGLESTVRQALEGLEAPN